MGEEGLEDGRVSVKWKDHFVPKPEIKLYIQKTTNNSISCVNEKQVSGGGESEKVS